MKKKFTFFSTMLLVIILLTAQFSMQAQTPWNGTADISWFDNSQTSFDISTPEQLAGLAELVNSGTSDFTGKTVRLAADIWLNAENDFSQNWTPIGGYPGGYSYDEAGRDIGNKYFQGTFDGAHYTVYNMLCDRTGLFHAGFFGAVRENAIIKNVALINPIVKSKGMAACLVGFVGESASSSSIATFSDCMVINGSVEGTSSTNNIGLICGATWPQGNEERYTDFINCAAIGNVSGDYSGGIAGNAAYARFYNCYHAGTVTTGTSSTNYGGISASGGYSLI